MITDLNCCNYRTVVAGQAEYIYPVILYYTMIVTLLSALQHTAFLQNRAGDMELTYGGLLGINFQGMVTCYLKKDAL